MPQQIPERPPRAVFCFLGHRWCDPQGQAEDAHGHLWTIQWCLGCQSSLGMMYEPDAHVVQRRYLYSDDYQQLLADHPRHLRRQHALTLIRNELRARRG
jgi:hypothetical protein